VTSIDPTFRNRRRALVTEVAPAAAYVGAIFYTGLIRLAKLPEVGLIPTDKLLHALAFGGLALLLVRAAATLLQRPSQALRFLFGVCGSSLFGALLEVCQHFVPYRSAEFLDWLADTLGALLAIGLLALCLRLAPQRAHG
jgi:VanZ family protein